MYFVHSPKCKSEQNVIGQEKLLTLLQQDTHSWRLILCFSLLHFSFCTFWLFLCHHPWFFILLCCSIRPPPPPTKTPVCASDAEQWEHFLHQGSVPGTSCGLHHLAGYLLPGEEVCQQCAERQERNWGHSQTHPGEHDSGILILLWKKRVCFLFFLWEMCLCREIWAQKLMKSTKKDKISH